MQNNTCISVFLLFFNTYLCCDSDHVRYSGLCWWLISESHGPSVRYSRVPCVAPVQVTCCGHKEPSRLCARWVLLSGAQIPQRSVSLECFAQSADSGTHERQTFEVWAVTVATVAWGLPCPWRVFPGSWLETDQHGSWLLRLESYVCLCPVPLNPVSRLLYGMGVFRYPSL